MRVRRSSDGVQVRGMIACMYVCVVAWEDRECESNVIADARDCMAECSVDCGC